MQIFSNVWEKCQPLRITGAIQIELCNVINVRECRRGNQNGKSKETGNIGYTRHKTKTNKIKTQHNMCWTPLCANKHK
jgi:hypothetical protein